MPMRRRMSIHCLTIRTAAANGEPLPARVPSPEVMPLERFMFLTSSTIITTTTSSTEAITPGITIPVGTMAVDRACSTTLPCTICIRTGPGRRSWRMNRRCRLTPRKLQVTVEQPYRPRSARKPPAIREHHLQVHHLLPSSSNNSYSNHICCPGYLQSLLVVLQAAPATRHFNNNSSNSRPPNSNSNTSNLNREPSHRPTNRTLSNLRNRSRLLPAVSPCNAPF